MTRRVTASAQSRRDALRRAVSGNGKLIVRLTGGQKRALARAGGILEAAGAPMDTRVRDAN